MTLKRWSLVLSGLILGVFIGFVAGANPALRYPLWNPRAWNSNWVLVIVTTAYVVVAIFQLLAIRRQADIAANAERPHVMVVGLEIYKWETKLQDRRVHLALSLQARNYGRTPAWPTKWFMRATVHESSDLKGRRPDYSGNPSEGAGMIVQEAPMNIQHTDPVLLTVSQQEMAQIMVWTEKRNLFVYGYVEYEGLGRRQETYRSNFGFLYLPPGIFVETPGPIPGFVILANREYWRGT